MKIICMIPARLGSQRLADKNMRRFAGAALLAHCIRLALPFCERRGIRLRVNTPDEALAYLASDAGAEVYMRPAAVSAYEAPFDQVVADFMRAEGEGFEWFLMWNTTSPCLTESTAERFLEEMGRTRAQALFSTVRRYAFFLSGGGGAPLNFTGEHMARTQDLAPVDEVAWALTAYRIGPYLAASDAGRCAIWALRRAVVAIPATDAVDIDTEEEWQMAQALWQARQGGSP